MKLNFTWHCLKRTSEGEIVMLFGTLEYNLEDALHFRIYLEARLPFLHENSILEHTKDACGLAC